ncbi:hypothetical protein [Nocardia yunnanensis]|uniref:hypothetical protein n=1 Tax=Nocardia yunnanensis TaxID=2382165 RepID=UPI0013C4C8F3|nr:hypothetical protein [Nocardia yunnanensis]
MNEDDSARREFVFGLFLLTVIAPLATGLATFAAMLGAMRISEALSRLRAHRDRDAAGEPVPVRPAAQRPRHRVRQRHTRRVLSNSRPGGALH